MTPLLATAVAAFVLFTLVWLLSLRLRDASVVDAFWGPGFALATWVSFLLTPQGYLPRKLLVAGLVTLWALRLSAHILWRSRGQGEDPRYQEMRRGWGAAFPWVSLLTVFWLQAAILWVVALPLTVAQAAARPATLTWLDGLGVALFTAGFLFEAVGDWQLARFKADPANKGRLLTSGLWRYTRHPNYFGDALLWWGLTCLALATPGAWWTVLSPALMTFLLMKVSGVSLLEKRLTSRKPEFEDYARRTSAFFPWFPRESPR